ncbi:MAG: UDP-N-acetylglucosamine 2-epimerase [Candidatus Shapirobacteria bacterium GW2011_GWE1_38_92]|uniref:UDP-N-acetylglucosamine 2-epimerase n=3 Tax=Candidatus Shapironibacteriota TaxID=1752721 RepID=A0A0G0MC70_9BACT|nr:MAG: UDP-N-acetylglucosamine 2-epimerase [Candidatus Shapirobacteria bacterium GW2011_GWE2_38_30]KKQ92821.1 MAG: UDP-N-acetylglucosamine 2-epimerase [Candidatus Shapirobacteria bacterium GW2011_GWE1_38_92]OGL56327.1 MAG: UDP-N-acetylglucosamine 2-epimerase [Candidatus Shapirobacteria bacterium RIFOXYB1_FULL_38_38]
MIKKINKICLILGTRPEIIKLSPIIRELQRKKHGYFIIHTNQHYSSNMDEIFFKELNLPQPKHNLNIGSGTHGDTTGRMLQSIESVLLKENPTWVIVQGDTNTVLAGALAASKLQIKIGHVEAGLRSYDRTMPEEINRILTDHMSDLLFCPTQKQANILLKEGIDKNKIKVTGNTIVDAVYQNINLIKNHFKFNHYQKENYFLLTTHRPSNVDNKKNLQSIIEAINQISQKYKVKTYFPVHPRTKKQLELFKIKLDPKFFNILEPVGYLEMLALQKNAKLIFTDSGGIQEEACILQVPSITLRENTERPETIEVGASILTGPNKQKIISATAKQLKCKRNWPNPFGTKDSSLRIMNLINK